MRRGVFIRLGKNDLMPNEGAADIIIDIIDNFGTLDRGMNQLLERLYKLHVRPSETAVDLMTVAASVYAADTGVSRERFADDKWTRMLELDVPVKDPDLWNGLAPKISDMLRFLTGDHWTLSFRPRPEGFDEFTRLPERLDLTDFTHVSLFSGGLDSLIGAI